jgi:GTP cyclohydrolase IB
MQETMTVDVCLKDLPFPMRVASRDEPGGQPTVASISVAARVKRRPGWDWTGEIIRILHAHRDRIGASTLRENIMDYLVQMEAERVRADFRYPFFYEKQTPVSREKCLLCYPCTYSAKVPSVDRAARIFMKIEIPVLASPDLFPGAAQHRITIETESARDVFPEDLVDLADRHALSPVYSFLTREDQEHLARLFKTRRKGIEETLSGINAELSVNRDIGWHSIRYDGGNLPFSYETETGADRGMLSPQSLYDACEA